MSVRLCSGARGALPSTQGSCRFSSASSCPVTVIVGQWGRAAVTGMTRSGSVSGSASSVSSGQALSRPKGWLYSRISSVSTAPHPKRVPKLWARDRM
ncbi:MAG: hypothetical protein ACLSHC_04950 [Bilophila wadsworthia]